VLSDGFVLFTLVEALLSHNFVGSSILEKVAGKLILTASEKKISGVFVKVSPINWLF